MDGDDVQTKLANSCCGTLVDELGKHDMISLPEKTSHCSSAAAGGRESI